MNLYNAIIILITGLFLQITSIVTLEAQTEKRSPNAVSGQLIIKTHGEITQQEAEALKEFVSIKLLSKSLHIYNLIALDKNLSTAQIEQKVKTLLTPAYSHPNYILEKRDTRPNDTNYSDQWYLEKIGAPFLWDYNTGGVTLNGSDSLVIAVIDGGFQTSHTDLKANIWVNRDEIPNDGIDNDGNGFVDDTNGWNFDLDKNVYSPDSHGTAVAGIIGAEGNNSKGVTGLNWKIKAMLLEVATVEDIVSAYDYVYNIRQKYDASSGSKGSFVVATSASLGISNAFPNVAPSYCDAIGLVSNIGVLNACATTNSNVNIDITGDLPSLCTADNMIVVNSTKRDDSRYSSGYSAAYVDLGVPGFEIYTTSLDNLYGNFQGTSAATPVLGGGIALLFSCAPPAFIEKYKQQPKQTAQELKQIILTSTDPLEVLKGKTVSGGRLNLRKAIETLNENYNGLRLGALSIDKLWPSPSTSNLNGLLTIPRFGDFNLTLSSADGKIVSSQKLTYGSNSFSSFQIDVKNLATGVYIVTIYNGKEKKSARFVKL